MVASARLRGGCGAHFPALCPALLLAALFHARDLVPQSAPTASRPARVQTWDEVRAQLGSNDRALVAWGAWNARRLKFKEAVPLLQEQLAPLRGLRRETSRNLCARALLDALIGLDGRLAADELQAWWRSDEDLREMLLLLAARDVAAHEEFLLRLPVEALTGPLWRARVALLLPRRPGEMASELLPAARLFLRVVVAGDEEIMRGRGPTIGTAQVRPDLAAIPFPPMPTYQLPEPAADSFSVGLPAVTFRRFEQRHSKEPHLRTVPGQRAGPEQDRADFVWLALNWLAGTDPVDRSGRATVEVRHEWQDAGQYLAAVARARAGIEARWRALGQGLVARGRARADQVPPTPLQVEVEDRRSEAREPLPGLPSK